MWLASLTLGFALDPGVCPAEYQDHPACTSGGIVEDPDDVYYGVSFVQVEAFLARQEAGDAELSSAAEEADPEAAKVLAEAAKTVGSIGDSIERAVAAVGKAEEKLAGASSQPAAPAAPAAPSGAVWTLKTDYFGSRGDNRGRGGIQCPPGWSFYGIPQENIGGCGKRFTSPKKNKAEAIEYSKQSCAGLTSCQAFSCREFKG